MNSKANEAIKLFKEGYNCSQAVLCAFCDELGIDFNTALKISSSFGGGMGRMREVCGAVSGLFMAAGLKYGYTSPDDKNAKAEHYKLIQELAEKFREKNGTIICRELIKEPNEIPTHIPDDRTKEYYKKRPCAELVGEAAEIFAEILEKCPNN